MVLASRIGAVRPFPLVLLFYVGTFGLYGIYWHYKAHQELHDQFELDLEQRQMGVVWLLLDRVFFPLRWVYQHGFVSNLVHVRQRMGMTKGISPAGFLALSIPGSSLVYIALVTAVIGIDTWWALVTALIAFLVGAGLQIPAFALLQRDLNQVWLGFDVRIEQIMPRREAWRPIATTSAAPSGETPPSQ